MRVYKKRLTIQKDVASFLSDDKTVGFVPTMGALHQGHLALVEKAMQDNDITIVSIFVNPTQFNNDEDLNKYPRTLATDVDLLKNLNEDILVFAPSVEEIYGSHTLSHSYDFDGLEHEMEGKFRPGHFDGVGTILKLLFEIIQPTRAYFGEKDFQQLQIVRKLVEKEKLTVEIVGCPIYREKSGLALSSRNKRLTPEHKRASSFIYQTLLQAKKDFGTESAETIISKVNASYKLHDSLDLEYFEIANIETLKATSNIETDVKYRAFIAVFAGDVRLIDNIALN